MPGRPDPLHGVTLEKLLAKLITHHDWTELDKRVDIHCFRNDPSIKSSLAFLHKTPQVREKVEALYVQLKRSQG